MKYTLLQLVQTIASSMDSDEVTSINDSVESLQIANVIRTVYFDIINRAKLPEHFSLVNLTASTDNTKPNLMYVPTAVNKIQWVKYDKRTLVGDPIAMEDVTYLPLDTFLERMYALNPTETDVDSYTHTVGTHTFTIIYTNNKQPDYYTTFDDNTVVFDSLDVVLDTVLQSSKSLCYASLEIPFELVDAFTPDLDEVQFALVLNEAKSLAWAELKQTQHGIAERNTRRGWTNVQKSKNAVEGLSDFDQLMNFGRK